MFVILEKSLLFNFTTLVFYFCDVCEYDVIFIVVFFHLVFFCLWNHDASFS